jgi:Fic family protein
MDSKNEKYKKLPKQVKEKIKKLEEEMKQLEKEIQLSLTKFLIEKGYSNPRDIAKLWSIPLDTAKEYIQEAENIIYDKRGDSDIEQIKNEKKVSWLEAIAIYYKELLRPKCGYGR